ncbi:ATP-grasp domain-containing protein [Cellulomonas bogoriensis]|uniref:ATP-grasp domain-containing protein n=1 Tax=Cellulomonas bogoriensis 69B4 = DSM 16987 TaxID=1386082 RepID=A0A0A0C3G6_9CELL|nr:hypothetical protein [Cellulomonas bogoriensis]KGM13914.1 hypothetical protein N869_07730 [Cellulomonas bogoriensis 69B4 = DSM 16987]
MTRIALATCSDLPDLDVEDVPLLDALRARGATAEAVVWDDESVDWAAYDLVVVRSTWDYAKRPDVFLEWAERVDSVTRLANPASVIRWNADKHYLRELEDAGVAVVPTIWLEPDPRLNGRALHTRFPAQGEIVIKPAVSAGSVDTGRYTAIDAGSRGLAIQHARRLLADDRSVMVQRYVTSVDTHGERAHVFIAGEYSHSVVKEAMLDGPDAGQELYKREQMSTTPASGTEVEMARKVIATACRTFTPDGACDPSHFLYARVDVVSDDQGSPLLMELEMVEPNLFTSLGEGALDRFADAIMARAS